MKIFAALAVIAIAVSASYQYKCPKLPCSFEMSLNTMNDEGKLKEFTRYTVYDIFISSKVTSSTETGEEIYRVIIRPDITKMVNDTKMIGVSLYMRDKCSTTYSAYSLDEYMKIVEDMPHALFGDLINSTWENKKSVKYNGKQCTVYYDDDVDTEAFFVYDDYPYVIRDRDGDTIVQWNWDWEASLDHFKQKDCGGDFAEAPSSKYEKCSSLESSSTDSSTNVASSIQAVSAVVFAVIAVSLVSLF